MRPYIPCRRAQLFSCSILLFALALVVSVPLDVMAGLPPIVFVSRNPLPGSGHVGDLPGEGPVFRTAVVGGRLLIRERNGTIRSLVDTTRLIDVADPCVSWNAKKIVFSGVVHPDSSWRIYEVRTDGTGFRRLTHSDRRLDLSQFGAAASSFTHYDDIDPCYLPDGRIVFASTRYPSMAMASPVRVTNLYVMDDDGRNMHRITTERNGGEEPAIDPVTGRIVYARWWANIDRPSNQTRNNLSRDNATALTDDTGNIWHAVAVNPDGDLLRLYAGFVRTRFGTQTYKPALFEDGRLLSTFSPRTSLVSGSGGTGVRWFRPGADVEHHVIGLKSDESLRAESSYSPPFAADPAPLSASSILLSYSPDGREYGIYSCDCTGSSVRKIVDFPGTLELEPMPVQARRVPPVVPSLDIPGVSELPPTEDPATHNRNDVFRFDCLNIFTNGKVDEPMPDAPRIAQDLTIQFFINPQRQSSDIPDPSILVKTAPVFYNGGVHEPDVTAEVPMFEQIIRRDGTVLETTDGRFAHVAGFNFERVGAGTKCVGCHIGHSMLEVPPNGSVAEWFNAAPSARVTASSAFRDEHGMLYGAMRAVDRQARTGGDSVIWIAGEGNGAQLRLQWQMPIEARQFTLYNIPEKISEGTTIQVENCAILLYYQGTQVGSVPASGQLLANGTIVSLTPTRIDAATITITKCSGTVKHLPVSGLAEVETIARLFLKHPNN